MFLILLSFFFVVAGFLFCIVQNKTPYDRRIDDEAQVLALKRLRK